MTSARRQGQPRNLPTSPAFRSRESSGFPVRGSRSLRFAREFDALSALVHSVDDPCWVFGTTAAALYGFDGFELQPPFHLAVPRGRFVNRIGHVIHTTTSLDLIDRSSILGLSATSATRTIIDLAASETRERLTVAVDSADRDHLSSEDFLHRRLVALRARGRSGIGELLSVLE